MSAVWGKVDAALALIYWNYLYVQEHGVDHVGYVHPIVAGGGKLTVSLYYTGDLATIEALGCETMWDEGSGRATVGLDLANLERLAEHPGVEKMYVGQEPKLLLDKSVPDLGVPSVWKLSSSGTFGVKVLIGIIDTGIDYKHQFFHETTLSGPLKTRILRIWDQGLQTTSVEKSPSVADLATGAKVTYGVEYTDKMIDDALQGSKGAMPVRHRDCIGHGTHVASIAAGNGHDKLGSKYVGVAPEARLIVVKFLDLEADEIKVGPVTVGWAQRFKDAVSYILNVAKNVFKGPVVINCSFGSSIGPHDGFTEEEVWLRNTFENAKGQALVQAAGNEAGRQANAVIRFPTGGGTVDIPFELYDKRTVLTKAEKCKLVAKTTQLTLDFWYEGGGPAITGALSLPGSASGGFHPGPVYVPPPATPAPEPGLIGAGGGMFTIFHQDDNARIWGGGLPVPALVKRRNLFITIFPDAAKHHLVGKYIVRLTSPGALNVYLWCEQERGYGFRLDTSVSLPTFVSPATLDRYQITSNAGAANTVAVAAYNAEISPHAIAPFSSRGPLVTYDSSSLAASGVTQPPKPDIAAPGVSIDAARSKQTVSNAVKAVWHGLTTPMGGTSMAAPHVTGMVALMLEKNPNLRTKQIIEIVRKAATKRGLLPGENLPSEASGTGIVNAFHAYNATP